MKMPFNFASGNNWYKKAQQNIPIQIVSYIPEHEELGISFNSGKKYIYPNVTPFTYNRIQTLLKVKNYRAVQKILKNLSNNRPDTKEEKNEMLDELYNRGLLS